MEIYPKLIATESPIAPYRRAVAAEVPRRDLLECWTTYPGLRKDETDIVRGGPNGDLSLTVARQNFNRIGAADPNDLAHVRPPTKDEATASSCPLPTTFQLFENR